MQRWWYFFFVFALNGAYSAFSFSSFKESRFCFLIAGIMGMLGSCLWIFMARSIRCPDQLFAYGFYSDAAAKAAGMLIPILMFGVKCDSKTVFGAGLVVSGMMMLR